MTVLGQYKIISETYRYASMIGLCDHMMITFHPIDDWYNETVTPWNLIGFFTILAVNPPVAVNPKLRVPAVVKKSIKIDPKIEERVV